MGYWKEPSVNPLKIYYLYYFGYYRRFIPRLIAGSLCLSIGFTGLSRKELRNLDLHPPVGPQEITKNELFLVYESWGHHY